MNFLDERLPDQFWSKCIPEPNSGCWLWLATTTKHGGHGRTYLNGGKCYACAMKCSRDAKAKKRAQRKADRHGR